MKFIELNWCLLAFLTCSFSQISTVIGQEIRVISTSGGYEPKPIPVMAFFESDLSVQFSINGTDDSLKGKDVIYALFQRNGKRIIPLGEAVLGGTVKQTEVGTLVSTLLVKVPKLSGRAQLAIKVQIDGSKLGKVVHFTALPDDMLTQLAGGNIRITGAEEVRKAFVDRNLDAAVHSLEDLKRGGSWSGLWFIALEGDARANLTLPTYLPADQVVILLEEDNEDFPFPIAIQKGAGWVVHFSQSWFEGFSTNAGTQSAFFNTINRINSK